MTIKTKHFGLKKLGLISKGVPRVYVSPHITLKDVRQYRSQMGGGRPRLLVRTDELGRAYKTWEWIWAPRFDARSDISGTELHNKLLSWLKEHKKGRGIPDELAKNPRKLAVLIHPTFKREDIAITG